MRKIRFDALILAAVILIGCLDLPCRGAEPADGPVWSFKQLPAGLFKDAGLVVTSPLHWTGRSLVLAGAVAGAGLLIAFADPPIRRFALDNRTSGTDDAAKAFSSAGGTLAMLGLGAGLYAAGEAFRVPGLGRTGQDCLESVVISAVLASAFKTIIGRARPYMDEGDLSFKPLSFKSGYASMPSGHSAAAWAAAAAIAGDSDSTAVDIAAYGFAALVSVSRIDLDKHWLSDTFFGAALGMSVGSYIVSIHRSARSRGTDRTHGADITAGLFPGGVALRLSWPASQ